MRVGVVLHGRRAGESGSSLSGQAATYNGSSWSAPTTVVTGEDFLDAVSCSSSSFCGAVATGFVGSALEGIGYTWNGTLERRSTPAGERPAWLVYPGLDLVCVGIVLPGDLFKPRRRDVERDDMERGLRHRWHGQPRVRVLPHAGVLRGRRQRGLRVDLYGDPAGAGQHDAAVDHGQPDRGHDPDGHHGTWTNNPTSITHQWEDCDADGNGCVPIDKATNPTYKVQTTDEGHSIVVQESAVNSGGTSLPASSAPTADCRAAGPQEHLGAEDLRHRDGGPDANRVARDSGRTVR